MASNDATPPLQPRPAAGTGSVRETPQAALSNYGPRMQVYNNALLVPILAPPPAAPGRERTTKRGTTIINYAEDGYDDDDDDDEGAGGRRRLTGLRSVRREDTLAPKPDPADRVGKDAHEPVGAPGVWRDWMSSRRLGRTDLQNATQSQLPCTLVPIRLDVDVPAFMTQTALPLHPSLVPQGADPSLFRPGEATVPYKIRDFFMWNLYESLITTDQFAQTLIQDLDLPAHAPLLYEISKQIRTQLEEYAGIALHALFRPNRPTDGDTDDEEEEDEGGGDATSLARSTDSSGREEKKKTLRRQRDLDAVLNPDDAYRCIIKLNITLGSRLYTDKFEWSLLHPPGLAEEFAKVTCADLGLHGEWIPALTHGIYEAVLRLKKEFIESGGLVSGWNGMPGEFPNDAAFGAEAGVCYDPEGLCEAREPRVEVLSKEEMEKREIDRERQLRRLRRETARISSTATLGVGGGSFSVVAEPVAPPGPVPAAAEEERMGRGERSKKKRRFGSLSPLRYGTPGTVAAGGTVASGGTLTDQERQDWRCSHCMIRGTVAWRVRNGPQGPKTLCMSCGYVLARDGRLPSVTKDLHLNDPRII